MKTLAVQFLLATVRSRATHPRENALVAIDPRKFPTMHFDDLLVQAKFAPPRIGTRHIPRRQLLDRLRETQHCTITLVTAGAGFGKTILLVQWRQELMKAGAEVAWLALTQDDRRGSVFCRYLLAAFKRLGIEVDDDTLAEDDHGARSIENVVAAIIAGAQELAKDIYLFIDDYHHVEDPWAHQLMQKLLTHSPGNLHIVISSRVAPALSISRLRVYGQVAEVDFSDLPFSREEAQAFFEQNLSTMKLTADELRLIQDMTQGWPATLQLIAIMLRSRPGTREQLHAFLWRSGDLQAYLAEDVIAQSPPALIAFLESISIFRRFNADLAAFVAGAENAADLLRRAEDESLLIQRVESDDRSPWFRFHPLLGEFLAARLAQRGKDAVEALHRRGSQWFASHDLLVEAVRHANLGGDVEFAVNAIEQAAPANWSLSYVGAMVHLLEHLPQEALSAHPRLFFLGCLTYALTARPSLAQRWLEQLRRTDMASHPAAAVHLALAEAAIATQRDDNQRVIALLERPRSEWPDNRMLKYLYLGALANAYARNGRVKDALRLLNDNAVMAEDHGSEIALLVEATLPTIYLAQGRVSEAVHLASALLEQAESSYGRHSVCASTCAAMLGEVYYELDRIDDAREVLANRARILRSSWPEVMIQASLCHARLDRLQQDSAAALAFLDVQAAHFHGLGLARPMGYMLAEQARILLADGDHIRADDVVARLCALGEAHRGASFHAELSAIAAFARARLALANFDASQALHALDEVRAFARSFGRERLLVRANLLAAVSFDNLEQHDAATQCLTDAVRSGAKLGLMRAFLDEGERIGPLLATVRHEPALGTQAAHYLDTVLDKLGTAPVRVSPSGTASLAAQHVSLTPRELEILLLISQAMSNKRIALTLNITVGTTKWNVRNILTKLGVSTRYDAMMWAREHGFIQ
ncbi:LuxR C-terminal-related transcriptional regulator [Paraburkholderia fungorum]|uniref:LuxR C-terminal-related transcriptional regulator n=1 Tax=Paraburkholderia TaxID=1822464 RepID=UPI0038BC05E5